MTRIDRYIRRKVVFSILVVTSLIIIVDLIFSVAEQSRDLDDNYRIGSALNFILMTLPTRIYEMVPFSVLGGTLLGLGILASNNELVVIQSAGVKVVRIVWAAMKPALLFMLINLLVGEYIAPPMEQLAQSNKALAISGTAGVNTRVGTWQKVGPYFIRVNAIAPGGELLYGLTRYEVDSNRKLLRSSFAETANYVNQGNASYWQLNEVQETVFAPLGTETFQYLQQDWRVDLSPSLLNVLIVEPDRQSVTGLYRFAKYFETEGLESANYLLAFWKKLLQPLATMAMILLAISFIFDPLRDTTVGSRIFIAMIIGLGFTTIQRLLEPISILYGFSPLVAAVTPILFTAALGLFLLRRTR